MSCFQRNGTDCWQLPEDWRGMEEGCRQKELSPACKAVWRTWQTSVSLCDQSFCKWNSGGVCLLTEYSIRYENFLVIFSLSELNLTQAFWSPVVRLSVCLRFTLTFLSFKEPMIKQTLHEASLCKGVLSLFKNPVFFKRGNTVQGHKPEV